MGMFWWTGDTYFTVVMAYQEHNSNTTSWCHSGQLPLICTPHKKTSLGLHSSPDFALSQSSTEVLVHAFVTSHIDYCNNMLSGLPIKLLNKLQIIHNSAARIITRTKSSDHITPILIRLHWLPVKYWIDFKTLLLTFKALHNLAGWPPTGVHPLSLSPSLSLLSPPT